MLNNLEKSTENELIAAYPELELFEEAVTVRPARREEEAGILAFLSERPWHSFGMLGYIYSYGLINPANRGIYYLCVDSRRHLEGVCLIGYHTLFEARNDQAILSFARLARACNETYLILGEAELATKFWHCYTEGADVAANIERHLLLRLNQPHALSQPVTGLRLATLADLDLVVTAHAHLGLELTGIDGSRLDPAGFRRRCAGRIARGHTWIWIQGGKIIFKIDLITETPALVYLESLWIEPQERGKGYGFRCLRQLTNHLLKGSACVCLLVDEDNHSTRLFYEKVGFEAIGNYKAFFKSAY